MTERPYVFVDVDGVLNAFFPCNKPRPTCKCHPGWTRVWARPVVNGFPRRYKLTLSPERGRWLTELADETGAELAWASYWQGEANQFVSPVVGLPEDLPYVPIPSRFGAKFTLGEWKARHVVEFAAGRPFVWFEDELDAGFAVDELAAELAAEGRQVGPHLVVEVDPTEGLQFQHVEETRWWLAELPGRLEAS